MSNSTGAEHISGYNDRKEQEAQSQKLLHLGNDIRELRGAQKEIARTLVTLSRHIMKVEDIISASLSSNRN